MNESSYILARQQYGLPYLRLRVSVDGVNHNSIGGLKQHSELYLLGYSVSTADGMDTEDRRKLLRRIIDSCILTKHEIINHLEWLIHTRSSMQHMENAVGEWSSDLRFVSLYNASSQQAIWIKEFKSRYT